MTHEEKVSLERQVGAVLGYNGFEDAEAHLLECGLQPMELVEELLKLGPAHTFAWHPTDRAGVSTPDGPGEDPDKSPLPLFLGEDYPLMIQWCEDQDLILSIDNGRFLHRMWFVSIGSRTDYGVRPLILDQSSETLGAALAYSVVEAGRVLGLIPKTETLEKEENLWL